MTGTSREKLPLIVTLHRGTKRQHIETRRDSYVYETCRERSIKAQGEPSAKETRPSKTAVLKQSQLLHRVDTLIDELRRRRLEGPGLSVPNLPAEPHDSKQPEPVHPGSPLEQ